MIGGNLPRPTSGIPITPGSWKGMSMALSSCLEPLTHADRLGGAYARPAAVVAEICQALDCPASDWPLQAQARGADRWRSETIVYLARRLSTSGQRDLYGKLVYALGLRTAAAVARWARGYHGATYEIIACEVDLDIIRRLSASPPTRQSEFLEVAFEFAVKRRTLQAVETACRSLAPPPCDYGSLDVASLLPCPPMPGELTCEDYVTARQLLRRVRDERHRKAYAMHHFLGWPLSASDPRAPTVCRLFGLSERQIRTWLRRAEADMRNAVGANP
jgi:hypothetical protein